MFARVFLLSCAPGFYLCFCFVACGAECLQVGVVVVVRPSGVVDVVDFEVLAAGVVVSTVLAGVVVAVEDCVSGCGGDVFCVVVPGHGVLDMRKPS